jgi:hypothetical protein
MDDPLLDQLRTLQADIVGHLAAKAAQGQTFEKCPGIAANHFTCDSPGFVAIYDTGDDADQPPKLRLCSVCTAMRASGPPEDQSSE